MEAKIIKTLAVLVVTIVILTTAFNFFSKSESSIGQGLLILVVVVSLYAAYKLIRKILTNT